MTASASSAARDPQLPEAHSPGTALTNAAAERAKLFALPGFVQGFGFWVLVELVDELATLPAFLGALFLLSAPTAFFLSVTSQRQVGPALFAAGFGGLVVLLAWSAQSVGVGAGFTEDGPHPLAMTLSLLGIGIMGYIAVPFYRTVAERRLAPNDYPSLFEFAWSLPVILLTASLFVGAFWLVLLLIGALFDAIGIKLLYELYQEQIFAIPVSFATLALGIGVVRGREGVLVSLRGILIALARILAPIFAVAMAVFIFALFAKGFDSVWTVFSPVGTLSATMIAGIVFFNAVISGAGRPDSKILGISAIAIAIVMVFLAIPSVYGLSIRIGDEGLTPRRIMAILVVSILAAYAVCYGISALARANWGWARQGNIALAGLVALLAAYVQTPFFAPYSWSAASQQTLAIERNTISGENIAEMAFEFGNPGRAALAELSENKDFADAPQRAKIIKALAAESKREVLRDPEVTGQKTAAEEVAGYIADGTVLVRPDGADLSRVVEGVSQSVRIRYNRSDISPVLLLITPGPDATYYLVQRSGYAVTIKILIPGDEGGEPTPYWQKRLPFDDTEGAVAFFEAAKTAPFGVETVALPVPVIGGELISPYDQSRSGGDLPAAFSASPERAAENAAPTTTP